MGKSQIVALVNVHGGHDEQILALVGVCINRIKGLLFAQGIRRINVMKNYKTLAPAELVTGDGRPLAKRLGREITREIERLALVQEQLVEIEHERDQAAEEAYDLLSAAGTSTRTMRPPSTRSGQTLQVDLISAILASIALL